MLETEGLALSSLIVPVQFAFEQVRPRLSCPIDYVTAFHNLTNINFQMYDHRRRSITDLDSSLGVG